MRERLSLPHIPLHLPDVRELSAAWGIGTVRFDLAQESLACVGQSQLPCDFCGQHPRGPIMPLISQLEMQQGSQEQSLLCGGIGILEAEENEGLLLVRLLLRRLRIS